MRKSIKGYLKARYAVYTPNFFKRHGLSYRNRFETWAKCRFAIEKELIEIVEVAKSDAKIDSKNEFSVGYSDGGYWASFLLQGSTLMLEPVITVSGLGPEHIMDIPLIIVNRIATLHWHLTETKKPCKN